MSKKGKRGMKGKRGDGDGGNGDWVGGGGSGMEWREGRREGLNLPPPSSGDRFMPLNFTSFRRATITNSGSRLLFFHNSTTAGRTLFEARQLGKARQEPRYI